MYFCKIYIIISLGGPGSQKGVLTQELAHEFDFTLINIEDIVFSYLPNKVANTVADISEIQEMLRVRNFFINL